MNELDPGPGNTESAKEDAGPRGILAKTPLPRPLSPVPTYLGILVAALGFALIAVAWGGVAGQNNVALQVPYLISGGMTGLAVLLTGLTIVNIAARRRDAALREQQTALLAGALVELGAALEHRR